MDLSQYVKSTGRRVCNGLGGDDEEKIIEKEDMKKLLDAKNGLVHIFAVVTSIYNEEKDICGGFFAKAYNVEHLLSKNFDPAVKEFDRLKEYLCKEHSFWSNKYIAPDKRKIKKDSTSNIAKAIFDIHWWGKLDGLGTLLNKGSDALTYGDKINLSINSAYLPLDHIEYSDKHKALCWTYEDYVTNYVPINLD